MKATLSATALGAILTCACGGALAQITATTTQQGIGNTAYTEQIGTSDQHITATIEQIGNNNRAGDPATRTPGIFQRPEHPLGHRIATIRQRGDENTASIVQERIAFDGEVQIQQVGNNNTAAVRQDLLTGVELTSLSQTGSNNVARVEISNTSDTRGFTGIQNGSENFLSFVQENGQFGGGTVIQTGFRNSATIDQAAGLSSTFVEQDGSFNTANISIQADTQDTSSSVKQFGTGNTATTTQQSTFGFAPSDIVQDGNNNLATVRQVMGSNEALIAQFGNNNSATVTQTGICSGSDRNVASIRQVGDGFLASITQSGAGNLAGIYQH